MNRCCVGVVFPSSKKEYTYIVKGTYQENMHNTHAVVETNDGLKTVRINRFLEYIPEKHANYKWVNLLLDEKRKR